MISSVPNSHPPGDKLNRSVERSLVSRAHKIVKQQHYEERHREDGRQVPADYRYDQDI